MLEDRRNDWLAQEMRREGYSDNSSLLEEEHQREEESSGWNAGAIKIKQMHEEEHNTLHKASTKPNGVSEINAEIIVFIALLLSWLLMTIIGVILG